MQTVLCENHFFESRLFGLSELHLALLGSSRPLPGQSWGPDGTQKPPKATPKLDQKWLQKGIQFWAALGPILGSVLGPKTVSSGGHIFQGFSEWLQSPLLAPSWLHFGSFLASLGLLWGPTWPLLAYLGPILAPSWPSWPFLSPSWSLLGLVLALLAVLGPILALPWVSWVLGCFFGVPLGLSLGSLGALLGSLGHHLQK